jgi:hypothetical protein
MITNIVTKETQLSNYINYREGEQHEFCIDKEFRTGVFRVNKEKDKSESLIEAAEYFAKTYHEDRLLKRRLKLILNGN